MQTFYSHGKLLLTAEYVVLDGARALALPTKFGQTLIVEVIDEPVINWKSLDEKGSVWFEENFDISNNEISHFVRNDNPISKRLIEIFQVAKTLNPEFLNIEKGYKVISILEFPNNWGLGSSSTLLNNIAQWANVNVFELSNNTFGGSGYDVACAQHNTAITYLLDNKRPIVRTLDFNKSFSDKLFFVHLNRKQNSRDSIKTYRENMVDNDAVISKIDSITSAIIKTETLPHFEDLIAEHEQLIGMITNQTPIKQRLFSDYKNQIKSLGGWNGDFVLVTGEKDYVSKYFKEKGFHTIIGYEDMIL